MEQNVIQENEMKEIAMRVSRVSIYMNLLLSVFKMIAGVAAHSSAMVSDAVHSASDVFSTFIVMIGIHISGKESDQEHPYGHDRFECVASIVLAIILAATGVGIGMNGLEKIVNSSKITLAIPGMLALIAAVVSIVVKEWMYWYTAGAAKKVNSGALMADAWHHRSDALSSVGSLIGIAGARLGFPILDPIAAFVICLFILKAAFDIFMDAINKMVDKSGGEELEGQLETLILNQEGVKGLDQLQTRVFGSKIYVDLEISADGSMTLEEAHEIAEQVHDEIEEKFPKVKHCMVHMNPYEE